MDTVNCSILTPVDQLIRFLVNVDGRLAKIDKEIFLETMINMATDEAMLLQMY